MTREGRSQGDKTLHTGHGTAPPPGVADRLAALSALYVPEQDSAARARLERERPGVTEPFATAVARRLRELRALCEMAEYLHRRDPSDS